MVVNDAFARTHLAGLEPLGQRINVAGRATPVWSTIVGVVGNARHFNLEDEPQPEVYRPLAQAPTSMMTLALRTTESPEALAPALRAAVAEIDPHLPVQQIASMRGLVEKSVATRRFYMSLLTVFAAVALVLAACGIYGVMSCSVAERVREMAIRLALGARPSALTWRVIAQGMRPVAAGIVLGVPAALALSRLIESQLFLTSRRDPLTLVLVCLTLAAAGAAAGWLPARRTARVDPLNVLRSE
jgi:putative ABC transport system permease protein